MVKKREWQHHSVVKPLDNLEVMTARFYDHTYTKHYHDGYALALILEGAETYLWNHKRHTAPKGSVIVINPAEIHNGHALDRKQGWKYFVMYPHLSLVKKSLADMGMNPDRLPWFPETVIKNAGIGKKILEFMKANEDQEPSLAMEILFLELFSLLIQGHAEFSTRGGHPDHGGFGKVKRVTDKIYSLYDTPLTLESLAKEEGVSSFSLLRLFKKHKGVTPYLMLTSLRINKAKSCLRSNHSFADTAFMCGYSDQSHMTKQFKKWIGITPGEYQRSNRKNYPNTKK
ncbi:AraC family transcriptional regulator [Desulfospira joergensenii]|uniref:AraC family transcriptional regulator n=1 Tax=Desulfospira joergensenii TaxID=53329 RepID=UPI0003B63257|nr:AraC family transcriptional regulator [Desulfospira joergensenii]